MAKSSTKTTKKPSADEKFERQDFDLFSAITAIDKKDYDWFDNLSEEQQRKFVPFMMLQWTSTIKSNSELTSYYLMSMNEYANKHMFNERVQQHAKLQWLMLCASSPGLGKQYHQWLPHLTNKVGELREAVKLSTVKEYFEKIYSNANSDTITACAEEFTNLQHHKHRLATVYPDMKIDDIEILALLTTNEELDEYDRNSGN